MGVKPFCKGQEQFLLPRYIPAVSYDSRQPHLSSGRKPGDTFGNIIGSVKGHELPGRNDIDFLGIPFPDRHGKAATNHISQHVVKNDIAFRQRLHPIQKLQSHNNSPACTAHTGLRTPCLHTGNTVKPGVNNIFFSDIPGIPGPQDIQYRGLADMPKQKPRRIILRVTADLAYPLPHET